MADIFATKDARKLLQNKFVLLLGDSNMRATYKDIVLLISRNELLSLGRLRKRGEDSFEGDRRIVFSGLIKGRQYEEGREFVKFNTHVEYHFITRCYNSKIEMLLYKIKSGEMKVPDVIIMNSCVWDINRWGPNGVVSYRDNMLKLMNLLKKCLPKETLFIWTTTLPVSTKIKGGSLIKQLDFMQSLLRFEVMEANLFCRRLIVSHGYDVLDIHYHLRMQVHRRLQDGIHFGPLPVRFITNLILTHISLSWSIPLPGNFTGVAVERVIQNGVLHSTTNATIIKFPKVPVYLCHNKEIKENEATSRKNITYSKQNTSRGGTTKRGRSPTQWNDSQIWGGDDSCTGISRESARLPRCSFMQPPQSNYWKDTACSSQQEYSRSNYANFDQAPGPMRRINKFPSRKRPY